MIIKESELEGLGAFAAKSYKPGKRWTFPMHTVCCEGHSYGNTQIGINGPKRYFGTTEWPYYINSTWPDTSKANCETIVDLDNMTLTVIVKKFIKRGQEITLDYNWTTHDCCNHQKNIGGTHGCT